MGSSPTSIHFFWPLFVIYILFFYLLLFFFLFFFLGGGLFFLTSFSVTIKIKFQNSKNTIRRKKNSISLETSEYSEKNQN